MNDEWRVMLVDDEPMIRSVISRKLAKMGCVVVSCDSGAEALEKLKDSEFHMIMLDLIMPDMNGIELCRKIRETCPLPVMYAITGFSSQVSLRDCRAAGFDDIFIKPISIEVLDRAVRDGFERLHRWQSA